MKFDIIIIGGGMVGAATAVALRSANFKVALIDAATTTTHDHRLIALNYSSICLLKNLGLWEKLIPHASAIKHVHVSHQGHFGITRLSAQDLQLPELGYVVPACYINEALYACLENITLIQPGKLKNLIQHPDQVELIIETPSDETILTGKIIIGADGTYSTVRQLLNISTTETDYHQTALVTQTELSRPHHQIAYERFLNTGAIAMLPLKGELAATIWTAPTMQIEELMQLQDDAFLALLQNQFGYRLGRFKKIFKRYTYPLKMIQADQASKDRVFLIGNALHTLHPIAAQGLNLALYEVAALLQHFTNHTLEDPKSLNLELTQQQTSLHLSHHLSWLFSQDFFIMNAARPISMIGLDLCQPLKVRFAKKALGRTGRLPPLLREQEL